MYMVRFYFVVCIDDSYCFCFFGLVGKCYFNIFDCSYFCVCGVIMGNVIFINNYFFVYFEYKDYCL